MFSKKISMKKVQTPARRTYEPITIKEPYKADVQHFNDADEFTQYYREHEDELKGLSTLRLNKTFKIPGYRISVRNRGKDDEELYLKKDYYGGTKTTEDVLEDGDNKTSPSNEAALMDTLNELRQRVENIESFLQQLRM